MNFNPNIPEQYRIQGFDIEKFLTDVIKRHNLAVDSLTEKQFVECLSQAVASGDFQRLIRTDGGQAITYIPFREVDALRSRVRFMESLCEAHNLNTQPDQCEL